MNLSPEEKKAAGLVYISMPYQRLDDAYLTLAQENGLHYEIGLNSFSLDRFSTDHFRKNARRLSDAGIKTNIHAPFNEIFPGSPDKKIRAASLDRLNQAFDLVPFFSPETVVVHLYYEDRRFGWIRQQWLEHCIASLQLLAVRAKEAGTVIALENVYEETPDIFKDVFDALAGVPVRMCADVGHINAFSWSDTRTWLSSCRDSIAHFHLHDNNGTGDQHRPIGCGTVDFEYVAEFISSLERKPVVTLEAHTREDIFFTLQAFCAKGLSAALEGLNQI